MIDLVAVPAIIALLPVSFFPALAAPNQKTQMVQCLSNTRQRTLGWIMYAGDHRNQLVPYNVQLIPCIDFAGGIMDWTSNPDNTNTALLVGGGPNNLMAPYVKSPRLFKCPADNYQSAANPGSRVRSYALNGTLGGPAGPMAVGTAPGSRPYYGSAASHYGLKREAYDLSDLVRPAVAFVMLDEQADCIGDGAFMFNPGSSSPLGGLEKWSELAASYHDGACCLSFADGHSLVHPWLERSGLGQTIYPVTLTSIQPWKSINPGVSRDYQWMDDHMPYTDWTGIGCVPRPSAAISFLANDLTIFTFWIYTIMC